MIIESVEDWWRWATGIDANVMRFTWNAELRQPSTVHLTFRGGMNTFVWWMDRARLDVKLLRHAAAYGLPVARSLDYVSTRDETTTGYVAVRRTDELRTRERDLRCVYVHRGDRPTRHDKHPVGRRSSTVWFEYPEGFGAAAFQGTQLTLDWIQDGNRLMRRCVSPAPMPDQWSKRPDQLRYPWPPTFCPQVKTPVITP